MNDESPDPAETPRVIPTFRCLVYVRSNGGACSARVANLAGIEATGDSERESLARIVPMFKSRVAEWLTNHEQIPWIEPPPEPADDEQKRLIPVHL